MKTYELQLQAIGELKVTKVRFLARDLEHAQELAQLRIKGSDKLIVRLTEVKDEAIS